MIKPTVGRVVWFWPTREDVINDHKMGAHPDMPMAATIVYVHNDRLVNLSIYDHNGRQFTRAGVKLLQDDDSQGVKSPGCAAWMPYQKGQAAKTEALEAKAAEQAIPKDPLTTLLGSMIADKRASTTPLGEAPKVTPEHLESVIASEHYFTGSEGARIAGTEAHPLDLVTFCTLVLRNGAKVVGINYGPVDPRNFDADKAKKYARENAIEQLWPLEGYLLKQRLYEQDEDAEQMLVAELDAGKAAAEALVDHIEGMGSNVGSILVRRGTLRYRIKVELDHD